MNIHTHQKIDQDLCGVPLIVENSYSKVQLLFSALPITPQ
jgi:hypothetical protein